VPTATKNPSVEKKKPKSQTIFLTPTASKKSQICEMWRQKASLATLVVDVSSLELTVC